MAVLSAGRNVELMTGAVRSGDSGPQTSISLWGLHQGRAVSGAGLGVRGKGVSCARGSCMRVFTR